MRIEVYQRPAGQGSKKYVGNGIFVESSRHLMPFREAIKWAIFEANSDRRMFHGPIAAMFTFTMAKPKAAPKTRVTYPISAPDVDKLFRSAGDACTQSGIWEDDARVVFSVVRKVFPGEHPDALKSPGVVIEIEEFHGTIPSGWIPEIR